MLKTDVVDSRAFGVVDRDAISKVFNDGDTDAIRMEMQHPSVVPEYSDSKTERFSEENCKNTVRYLETNNQAIDSLESISIEKGKERKTKTREKYRCSACILTFERQSAYKKHMVKHSDSRPFVCPVCDKSFKRSSEVSNHVQIHRGIQYMCDVCNFTTINKISLRTHKRRVHQRDFRYRCEQCDKGFMSNYDLEDHKSSHLDTKTFVCEYCGNAYSQKSYLVAHKRVIHGIKKSVPKEHQCNVCSKSFASEHNLRNHVTLHSQRFLCAQCGKEFATNHALKLHNRKHTGERPYQCKLCSKAFARSPALRVHKLTHTGERPYVCDLCGQSFTQRSSMMAHRRKHPGSHPPPPPLLLSRLESNAHNF